VKRVRVTGETVSLEPMNPFERKVCHDVVAAEGLISESEGAEPQRYVVVLPAEQDSSDSGAETEDRSTDGDAENSGRE
jgi:single-stranded nucleic acid binding R3H domain protein